MTITLDAARQFGKRYVGALNTGPDALAELLAPDAEVGTDDAPGGGLEALLAGTPPGRAWFRGASLDGEAMLARVRVLEPAGAREQVHRITLDGGGRIATLRSRV